VDQAKNSRWGAQANRDATAGSRIATDAQKDQAEAQVLNAEVAVSVAEVQLAQVDEDPKYAAVASAKAQIAQAESNLARLLSLPSEEDIALVQAQVEQARLNLAVARERLDSAELTAPMSGELASWDLHVGDLVQLGAPVGTIVDTARYHVTVSIDETDIGLMRVGQRAIVTLDAFPDAPIEGRLTRIDLLGQNAQGIVAFPVRVDLEPTDLAVRPLMTAAVEIVVESKDDVLLVNRRAIRRDQNGKYVEILVDNVPEKVYIETGVSDDAQTEIVAGLESGQEVIVGRPRESLFEGGGFGGS
jgi:HlyD family secretion protein